MTQESKKILRSLIKSITREKNKVSAQTKRHKGIKKELSGEEISLYLMGVHFGAELAVLQIKEALAGKKIEEETIKPDNHE